MSKVKRQHYVPRCYLRNFSDNGSIHVFDKVEYRNWQSNIESISSERYFYDIDVKEIIAKNIDDLTAEQIEELESLDEQFVEKFFSTNIESLFSKMLKNLITLFTTSSRTHLENSDIINNEFKKDFSYLLAYQIYRTKEFRNMMIESNKKMTIKSAEMIAHFKGIDLSGLEISVEEDSTLDQLRHASFVLNMDGIEQMAKALFSHTWTFLYNDSKHPLYTSDVPIQKRAHKEGGFMSYNGYGSPGIEICFPISSKIMLVMYERSYFKEHIYYDKRLMGYLDEENVKYYNSFQVNGSRRQVYCKFNKMGFARFMVRKDPELRNIDYDKFEVY